MTTFKMRIRVENGDVEAEIWAQSRDWNLLFIRRTGRRFRSCKGWSAVARIDCASAFVSPSYRTTAIPDNVSTRTATTITTTQGQDDDCLTSFYLLDCVYYRIAQWLSLSRSTCPATATKPLYRNRRSIRRSTDFFLQPCIAKDVLIGLCLLFDLFRIIACIGRLVQEQFLQCFSNVNFGLLLQVVRADMFSIPVSIFIFIFIQWWYTYLSHLLTSCLWNRGFFTTVDARYNEIRYNENLVIAEIIRRFHLNYI